MGTMTSQRATPPSVQRVTQALDGVQDPEIHRPITELGMVKNVEVGADGAVLVEVYLTVAGCPLRDTITRDVTAAVGKLPGVSSVRVQLDVMSDEQRRALQTQLRGGRPDVITMSASSLEDVIAKLGIEEDRDELYNFAINGELIIHGEKRVKLDDGDEVEIVVAFSGG